MFKFDSSSAEKDGHDKDLVKIQKDNLNDLNAMIKQGKLKALANLDIVNLEQSVADGGVTPMYTYSCPGKNTFLAYHWCGVDRYWNNCNGNRFAAGLASVAAGYGTAGLVSAVWFPGVGVAAGIIGEYAALMSSRVYANNYGYGVYVAITYVAFFNIEPQ